MVVKGVGSNGSDICRVFPPVGGGGMEGGCTAPAALTPVAATRGTDATLLLGGAERDDERALGRGAGTRPTGLCTMGGGLTAAMVSSAG